MINYYVIFRNVDGFLNSLPILAQHFPWSLVLLLIASPFSTCSIPTHDNLHGRVWRRHGRRRRGHWMRPRRRRRRRHWQRLRRAQQPRCSAAGRGEGCHLNGFNRLWLLCQHTNRLYLSQTWTKSSWNNTSIKELKIHQDSISTLGQFSFGAEVQWVPCFTMLWASPTPGGSVILPLTASKGAAGAGTWATRQGTPARLAATFTHPSIYMHVWCLVYVLSIWLSVYLCMYIHI